jgi:hypothetical protein
LKPSIVDPVISIVCGCFLFYFICLGHGIWHGTIVIYGVEQDALFIHEGIVYAGLFGVMFGFLYVFRDLLYPFNRNFIIRQYHLFKRSCRRKIEEGKQLTREYLENRRSK